jgi:Tfp pilus assembly protein PilW
MRRRRGVTILEAAMAGSLMTIVMVGVVGLSITSGRTWSRGSARIVSEDSASIALQVISQDIRGGSSASVDSTGKILTITSASTNAAGDYDRTSLAGTTTRYYVSSEALFRQFGSATPRRLATKVTGVSFAVNGQRVAITLASKQKVGTKETTSLFQSEVTLRNPPVL